MWLVGTTDRRIRQPQRQVLNSAGLSTLAAQDSTNSFKVLGFYFDQATDCSRQSSARLYGYKYQRSAYSCQRKTKWHLGWIERKQTTLSFFRLAGSTAARRINKNLKSKPAVIKEDSLTYWGVVAFWLQLDFRGNLVEWLCYIRSTRGLNLQLPWTKAVGRRINQM